MVGRRRLIAGIAIGATVVTGGVIAVAAYTTGANRFAGNVRAPAARHSSTSPTVSCVVRYDVVSQHGGWFMADLTLTGAQDLPVWRLAWSYDAGQTVRGAVGADWQQRGAEVTLLSERGAVGADRTVRIRLHGTYDSGNPAPSAFTLNGSPCRIDGAATTTAAAAATTTTPTTTTPTTTGGATAGPTSSVTSPVTSPSGVSPTPTAPGGVLGAGRIRYGRTYTGDGTFYGATGEGNCMYEASSDLMVAAMNRADYENSQACGAYVEVTGPKGTVTAKIVDQCPECRPGDLDLSAQAFAKIADPIDGRIRLSWRLLSPALRGPLAYRYKEGSSQWWCGIQVRNHRNPVRSVEARIDGAWKRLPRQEYNYFLSPDGSGCGKRLRITDVYGNQVTHGALPISVGVVQTGSGQFGPPR